MRAVLIVLALLPAPAAALEICDDLWFTRNLMFHRAGYCFGSELGKTVFGNEGCEQGGVELGPEARKLVDRILLMEKEFECDIDTGQDFLAVPVIEERKGIIDPPLATETESACVGWKGERLVLRTERSEDGLVSGAARPGDTLLFQFEDVDGWSFVEVQQNGIPAGLGWAQVEIGEDSCEMVAG